MRPRPFRLEAFFEEFEHVPGMFVLGSSDAQTLSVGELLKMSDVPLALEDLALSYQDVKGDEGLRSAVAEMYGAAYVRAENVLITNGASEAIFLSLQALLEPGDEALICRPVFQSVPEVAEIAGAAVRFYDYVEQDDFRPDVEAVRAAIGGESPPKLLFINTPHNPTGRAMDEATLRTLLREAQDAGVAVLVNEMYSGVWMHPTKPVPSAVALNSEAMIIAGLSKVFGLAGLRIGWVVGPADFIQTCKELRYYTSLCPPAILQKLGEIAVRNREKILERTRQVVHANYKTALQWLDARHELFDRVEPDAGQVMLIRLKRDMDTELFARELALKAAVLLIPCTTCFEMGQGYLRLGLGGEPSRFAEGLKRLSDFLRDTFRV
jgi:aspartate/methionine/tyrosine aminotransferase